MALKFYLGTDFMGRYSELLEGQLDSEKAYNRVLLDFEKYVVAPTLGSILPKWFLLIPKCDYSNLNDFVDNERVDVPSMIESVLNELDCSPERALWFEHGAKEMGSKIGCGVDHAHLHLLIDVPFSLDDLAAVTEGALGGKWSHFEGELDYELISNEQPYLAASSYHSSIIHQPVGAIGSQFFRRAIARLAGIPNEWDYRSFQHLDNVRDSISFFDAQRKADA